MEESETASTGMPKITHDEMKVSLGKDLIGKRLNHSIDFSKMSH